MTHPILERWGALRNRLDEACRRAGRAPEAVEVAAVVKYAALDDVSALREAGVCRWFAESRVQDAQKRRLALGESSREGWRFVGHLQTNKAKAALELFDRVDSLDSMELAAALQRRLEGTGRTLGVLVQVKLSERETQSGLSPDAVAPFLERLKGLSALRPSGLMGIAPQGEDPRPAFRTLKRIFDESFGGRKDAVLSMGMSGDCEAAAEEGATLVRVGSALFG